MRSKELDSGKRVQRHLRKIIAHLTARTDHRGAQSDVRPLGAPNRFSAAEREEDRPGSAGAVKPPPDRS
jgi:hypothetical protein